MSEAYDIRLFIGVRFARKRTTLSNACLSYGRQNTGEAGDVSSPSNPYVLLNFPTEILPQNPDAQFILLNLEHELVPPVLVGILNKLVSNHFIERY